MTFVFVHGLGQRAAAWDAVREQLPRELPVDCPELYSFLDREKTDYDTLYGAFSAHCLKLPELLHLCGLSLGGLLSLQFASEFPEKAGVPDPDRHTVPDAPGTASVPTDAVYSLSRFLLWAGRGPFQAGILTVDRVHGLSGTRTLFNKGFLSLFDPLRGEGPRQPKGRSLVDGRHPGSGAPTDHPCRS